MAGLRTRNGRLYSIAEPADRHGEGRQTEDQRSYCPSPAAGRKLQTGRGPAQQIATTSTPPANTAPTRSPAILDDWLKASRWKPTRQALSADRIRGCGSGEARRGLRIFNDEGARVSGWTRRKINPLPRPMRSLLAAINVKNNKEHSRTKDFATTSLDILFRICSVL